MRLAKFIIPVLTAIMCCFMLISCTGEKNGKKELVGMMFSEYETEAEYVLDCGGEVISGKMKIIRGDRIRLEFLSPDPFTGICAVSDADDRAALISIEYSGIKADVPKSVIGRLGIIFSMFSDTAASAIDRADKDNFFKCEVINQDGTVPYEVTFTAGEVSYRYIYDSLTGKLLDMTAGAPDVSVQLKII